MLNLTPHTIVIRLENGDEVEIPPSGTVARVTTVQVVEGELMGVPIISKSYGPVTGLPEEGTPCIVSAMVLAAVPGRAGVYAPDTGATAIRGENGQIRAVMALVRA